MAITAQSKYPQFFDYNPFEMPSEALHQVSLLTSLISVELQRAFASAAIDSNVYGTVVELLARQKVDIRNAVELVDKIERPLGKNTIVFQRD